jgi:YD repeat-containing protein
MFHVNDKGEMIAIHDDTQSYHAYAYDENGIITSRSGHNI